MKRLLSYWPVGVFVVSSVAHTDLAIFARPALQRALDVGLTAFLVWLVLFSTLQLWFEYWFYGWCRTVAITDVWAWLTNGFWDWCQRWGFAQPIRQIGLALKLIRERWTSATKGWRWREHKAVAGTSYSALFAVSVSPVPGIRGPAVAVCGVLHLRWGLVLITLGNALRNVYLVLGLRWILSH